MKRNKTKQQGNHTMTPNELTRYAKKAASQFVSEFNCHSVLMEELVSEATLAVYIASQKNNSDTTFNSYLYKYCRGYLYNFLQKEMKFSKSKQDLVESKTELRQGFSPSLLDIETFSQPAQTLIKLILEQPQAMQEKINKATLTQIKKAAKQTLKEQGFNRKEIQNAFAEIKTYYAN